MQPRTRTEQRAMGVVLTLAFAALFFIALPVAAGLVFGALVAFTLEPLHEKLSRRIHRPRLSAALLTTLSTLLLTGILAALVYSLVPRGEAIVAAAPAMLDRASSALAPLGVHVDTAVDRLKHAATDIVPRVAGYASMVGGALYKGVLALLFMTMTIYVVLRGWPRLVRCLETVLPLPRRVTRTILEDVRTTSRHVMLGTFVTGVVQGCVAGVGYWIFGVPEPAFFGAMTAVASLFPVLGTMFVWIPIGVYLFANGKPVHGALELAWGAVLVVAMCDYLIRAKLVGDHRTMKLFPTLLALFGGFEVFGVAGLVLGPIAVALALHFIALYRQGRQGRAQRGGGRVDSAPWPPLEASRLATAPRPRLAREHRLR